MRIKTFEHTTMSEAMAAVKTEMGKEAVILDVKEVHPGLMGPFARPFITVVAATDLTHTEEAVLFKKPRNGSSVPDVPCPAPFENPCPNGSRTRQTTLDLLEKMCRNGPSQRTAPMDRDESAKVARGGTSPPNGRCLSEGLVAPVGVKAATHGANSLNDLPWEKKGILKSLYQKVLATGLDRETASHLFGLVLKKRAGDALTEESVSEYLKKVIREWVTRFACPLSLSGPEKVVALVGPTGVGKTTTLIKIATRLYQAQKKVTLATLDTYRVGAVEQLRTYAQILGVPIRVISSPDALQTLWKDRQEGEYLLIDTAGRSPLHDLQLKQLTLLASVPIEAHLVLATTTRLTDLEETFASFSRVIPIDRLLFTKLDETKQRGSLFSMIRKVRVPPSYFTAGQRVPEDIEEATADRIAEEVCL